MARQGRGFPLGTQYQALWRTVATNPLTGDATFTMSAAGTITVVSSVIASLADTAPHRFRSVQVPPMDDLEAVQRQMQRSLDEISLAVNPVRSVADGGTGLEEVTPGAMMVGTGAATLETLPIGTNGQVLGIVAGKPAWQAPGAGAGEINTASNVNVGGTGVFKQKTLVNLEFRGVNALAAGSLVVALDAANNKIDFSLSGDLAAPGNSKLYGTNGGGVKGWYAQPVPVWTEIEVDFGGGAGLRAKTFTVADAAVTAASKIICAQSGQAPTGKPADDMELDALRLRAKPGAGTFDLYVDAADGFLINKYKILYQVA